MQQNILCRHSWPEVEGEVNNDNLEGRDGSVRRGLSEVEAWGKN